MKKKRSVVVVVVLSSLRGESISGVETTMVAATSCRSDGVNLGKEDPPPWEMRWSFESHLLNLRGTTTTEKDDDESRIDIKAKVETSGPHSYFVNADVTGHVRCRCVSCEETFRHQLKVGLRCSWTNGRRRLETSLETSRLCLSHARPNTST